MAAQKKLLQSSTEDKTIVYISNIDSYTQNLKELMASSGFSLDIFPSFGAWRSQESLKKICGIVVDFKTLMTTDPDNRSWFEQIRTVFPVLTIFPAKSELGFRVTFSDRGMELLEEIKEYCESVFGGFHPTAVRRHVRYDRYLRVVVQCLKRPEVNQRAFTLNISMGGLYVVLNDGESFYSAEDRIKIQFLDIFEEGASVPVEVIGTIRFIRSWENARNSQPGIGFMAEDQYLHLLKAIVKNQLLIRR